MHLHNCRCFQEHLRMLLQSLRKKQWNCDQRAMCNATRGIDAGRGVICHRGVSDGSDGARPLWRSHSARTEMFFADASPSSLGVLNEVNRSVPQSISSLQLLNPGTPSTRSYALIGTTSTSGSWTGAILSIYWTDITVLRHSLACAISWPSRPCNAMCAASWRSPTLFSWCGDMKMLVAPHSMSAGIRCNSLCWSCIWTS